jgi:hypothetical protein
LSLFDRKVGQGLIVFNNPPRKNKIEDDDEDKDEREGEGRILTLPRVLPGGGGARLWQSPAAAHCWHAMRWKQSEHCGWSVTQPRSVDISRLSFIGDSIKIRLKAKAAANYPCPFNPLGAIWRDKIQPKILWDAFITTSSKLSVARRWSN